MSFRQGIVVDTHPEDHSVDLVMVDTGERVIGVQVKTLDGSARTGTVDLPAIPKKKDKWDITEKTDQDLIAIVGYIGRQPFVNGFLFPQINQMLSKDPKRKAYRHQSDSGYFIDGDGNFQYDHPSGFHVRIGENPDREETENKNADASAKVDRNTDKLVNLRIGLAGGKGTITVTPAGQIKFVGFPEGALLDLIGPLIGKSQGDISFEAQGNMHLKATGTMLVEADGATTVKGSTLDLNP